jgi:hypothetical protein
MSRTVTLAVVDDDGRPLGTLPPFTVDIPYWQEVSDIVAAARDRYGVEVTVLRLLSADQPAPHGGALTYLAQASHLPPQFSDTVHNGWSTPALTPHPKRAAYAVPGGPAAGLAWASEALHRHRLGPVLARTQIRSWNLSAIWRLDTASGPVWLKHVPAFFAHEATVLRWLASDGPATLVPQLIDDRDARMLLAHVPGEDLYHCPPATRHAIAADLHTIHTAAVDQTAALLAAGVPDQRAGALVAALTAVIARHGGGDSRLGALADGLGRRMDAVTACGVPDTLVHGDAHPGNVIGTPDLDRASDGDGHHGGHSHGADPHRARRVIIDWGDSFIGHPGFDLLRLTGTLDPADAELLEQAWVRSWRATAPGSDPGAALRLLRPVAALRLAAVYAAFLDHIEPAEHPYHRDDVDLWLARAASLYAHEVDTRHRKGHPC